MPPSEARSAWQWLLAARGRQLDKTQAPANSILSHHAFKAAWSDLLGQVKENMGSWGAWDVKWPPPKAELLIPPHYTPPGNDRPLANYPLLPVNAGGRWVRKEWVTPEPQRFRHCNSSLC